MTMENCRKSEGMTIVARRLHVVPLAINTCATIASANSLLLADTTRAMLSGCWRI